MTAERGDFWASADVFNVIRDVARGRGVGPWAVLGSVLVYVCSRVGPHVVLPATVGGVASLNLFVGLVGPPGAGKDAALAVARELLYLNDSVPTHEIGTGQGIDSAYTEQTKAGPVQFCDAALFTLTEIDSLAAHAAMGGATVMATLRKVYSGAALGARYADRHKRRPVGEHRYRAALVAGIQPARSGVLLGDADGGTPQRWLWLPANDPDAPSDRPVAQSFDPAIGALWTKGEWHAPIGDTGGLAAVGPRNRHQMQICEAAYSAIVAARHERLTADLTAGPAALDGHALLTRLKVAALLAILCRGDDKVGDEDWTRAGVVMAVSDETRKVCADALAETLRRTNASKAHAEADRDDMKAARAEQAAARVILNRLRRGSLSGWIRRSVVYRDIHSRYREHFDAAIAALTAAGQIQRRTEAPKPPPDWDPFSGSPRPAAPPAEEIYRATS